MFEIQLTRAAQKFYNKANAELSKRLNRCFDQLSQNPFSHPNITRLTGSLSGYHRYRVGDYRVVYYVNKDDELVIVTLIAHRREVYR